MRITIDTSVDTYEGALAAVRAAFGVPQEENPPAARQPALYREAADAGLSTDLVFGDWSEQLLYVVVATLKPTAEAVLRCVAENAPRITFTDVVDILNHDPDSPHLDVGRLGGAMTSLRAVVRRQRALPAKLLDRDHGAYVIDARLAQALLNVFRAIDTQQARHHDPTPANDTAG